MSIRIIKQGLFDSIQDDGRYGFQHLGINPNGVMDAIAAASANMLAGNNMHEAVIEMHFPAAGIKFEKSCLMALSGADFTATIHEQEIPLNTAIVVSESSVLAFKKYKRGARCYLAVHGGFKADKWLNSYSTNTKVKAGGFHGSTLKKNNVVFFNKETSLFTKLPHLSFIIAPLTINTADFYKTNLMLCTIGKHYHWLTGYSKKIFTDLHFTISAQTDRMGYRLNNAVLQSTSTKQLLSEAVTKGAIQLLPDGNLIILMADHQTTGGYPVIANVISAYIPTLAQILPGASLQFRFISIKAAEALYIEQQENLYRLEDACKLQLNNFFAENDFN